MKNKNTFTKKELINFNENEEEIKFDKYVSPFLNWLNSVAGSQTGPKKVGQLSELFQLFLNFCEENKTEKTLENWKKFYLNNQKINVRVKSEYKLYAGIDLRNQAITNIFNLFLSFQKELFTKIDKKVIEKWVDNLLFDKTFKGMMLEKPIALISIKKILELEFPDEKLDRKKIFKSNPNQESKGIDFVYLLNNKEQLYLQIKTGEQKSKDNINNADFQNKYLCVYKNKTITIIYNNQIITKIYQTD